MKPYRELSKEELLALQAELQAEYDAEKEKDLNLDISRGKPGKEQLDLSMPMMDVLNGETVLSGGGTYNIIPTKNAVITFGYTTYGYAEITTS